MNLTELVPAAQLLTEEEKIRFLEKLWALLARQAERYTMGESTSVPTEIARELLASICYTLELSGQPVRSLLEQDLNEILKTGQACLVEKVKETRQLWAKAYAGAQEKGKRELMEDLAWIKPFFGEYDLYFFAHRTPWDMGLPMPETEGKGISCVEAYLTGVLYSDLHPA